MDRRDLDQLARLSPFELKNILIERATSHAERLMLNAGRGNPNFVATDARRAFFAVGQFALREAESTKLDLPPGTAGLPAADGVAARVRKFSTSGHDTSCDELLRAAIDYGREVLGFVDDAFVHELVQGILGCVYPEPPRMLPHAEAVVRQYLLREMGGPSACHEIDLCAVEGASAGVTYIFNSLRENGLIKPGDTIAIGAPIFTPYLEIPLLNDFKLVELLIRADPAAGWRYPNSELAKLEDPKVKALLLVNPGNPASVKLDARGLAEIEHIVTTKRKDLLIISDDVYATFADDFTSVFARCPRNTILVYSFSKYFGATGWRLGVVATVRDNVVDEAIRDLPEDAQQQLDARYASLAVGPRRLRFIDRLMADSRAIAFNHTAGLSTPQQVQMALFALCHLLDRTGAYKEQMKCLIRRRYEALYKGLGISVSPDPNLVGYYAVLDLELLGAATYGDGFVDWLLVNKNPLEILFRLAETAGVVLLPGKGFGTPHPSARVSLANLSEDDYARIGRIVRATMDDYFREFQTATGDVASGSAVPRPI